MKKLRKRAIIFLFSLIASIAVFFARVPKADASSVYMDFDSPSYSGLTPQNGAYISTGGGGFLICDGTNDYVDYYVPFSLDNDITFEIQFNYTNPSSNRHRMGIYPKGSAGNYISEIQGQLNKLSPYNIGIFTDTTPVLNPNPGGVSAPRGYPTTIKWTYSRSAQKYQLTHNGSVIFTKTGATLSNAGYDYLMLCSTMTNSATYSTPYGSYTAMTINYFSISDTSEFSSVTGSCNYLTGYDTFATGSACSSGTFTGYSIIDDNGIESRQWTCQGAGSGATVECNAYQNICGTDLNILCKGNYTASLMEQYPVGSNDYYRACTYTGHGLEDAVECSLLDVQQGEAQCGTYYQQYFAYIPDPTTGGNGYCYPTDEYMTGYFYNTGTKAYQRNCIDPNGTGQALCGAKGVEYVQPVCGPRHNQIYSEDEFSFDEFWTEFGTGSPNASLCSNGYPILTGETRRDIYSGGVLYYNQLVGRKRACVVDSEENVTVQCSTILEDGADDPNSILFTENENFVPTTEYRNRIQKSFNKFLSYVGLKDIFEKFFPTLTPTSESFIFDIPTPDFADGHFTWTNTEIPLSTTDFTHYTATTCTSSECTVTIANNEYIFPKSGFYYLLPIAFGFLHVILSLFMIFAIVFYPMTFLFQYVKEPLLFLSIRHIDDHTSLITSRLITFASYIVMGGILIGLVVFLYSVLSGIIQTFITVSYIILSSLLLLFGQNLGYFQTTISMLTAFLTVIPIVFMMRYISRVLP